MREHPIIFKGSLVNYRCNKDQLIPNFIDQIRPFVEGKRVLFLGKLDELYSLNDYDVVVRCNTYFHNKPCDLAFVKMHAVAAVMYPEPFGALTGLVSVHCLCLANPRSLRVGGMDFYYSEDPKNTIKEFIGESTSNGHQIRENVEAFRALLRTYNFISLTPMVERALEIHLEHYRTT